MVQYRYYTADILTGSIQIELPLFNVNMDRSLSNVGSFSGTYQVGSGRWNDDLIKSGIVPGKHALYVERNGVPVWSGPIAWYQYTSQDRTVSIQANTWEWVFDRVIMTYDCAYQNVEQTTLLTDWLSKLQAQDAGACAFGFTIDCVGGSSVNSTVLLPAYEYHFASDVLQQLVGTTNGITYSINSSKVLKVRYAQPSYESSGMIFDFPGTIDHYWLTNSGTKTFRKNVALGAGSGLSLMAAEVDTVGMTDYPMWSQVQSFSDVSDANILSAKAASMSALGKPSVYQPTFQLRENSGFEGWDDLGNTLQVIVFDEWNKDSLSLTSRMTGWSLTPSSSSEQEVISLTLESDS